MSAVYSYTSELMKCPHPGCEKPQGIIGFRAYPPGVKSMLWTCQHCGKQFTVKVASYRTSTNIEEMYEQF
jgi:hypothetical protein